MYRNAKIKPRSVTVAFYNANGLKKQRDEVFQFVKTHLVDIMLVQETFLKPSDRNPGLANFSVIRNDRVTSAKGGTLVYYKKSLHCVPIDTPPLTNLEASCCRLAMTGHQSIIIGSCYLSPSKRLLDSDLEALFSLGNSVILAGDFNSKHVNYGCLYNTGNGLAMDRLSEVIGFDVIPPLESTHYPFNSTSPDILDIPLLRNVALSFRAIEVLQELNSDHRPVILRLGPDPSDRAAPPPTKTVVDWKRLGESLKTISSPALDRIPDDIVSTDDIDRSIDALTSHLETVIGESSRRVPAVDHRRCSLPEDARKLITARNAAIRAHDSFPSPDRKSDLQALHRAVRFRLEEVRNDSWDDFMTDIKPSHVAFYKVARKLKTETQSDIPPLNRDPLPPAFEDDEKAECLAGSLEEQCSLSDDHVDHVHTAAVDREIERRNALPPSDPPPEPVKAAEVESIIKGLKVRKSPGADGISNRVLKHFSVPLVYLLVSIFNAALSNHSFPVAWKSADVIGIHKPGKKASEPSSYRPISLLSSLGKIYERIILKRLWSVVKSKNLIPDEQFGFRPRHSCIHQVHRITEHILTGFNKKPKPQNTVAVFLDVAKAFDKVWHAGLIYKLYQIGMPDHLVLIVQDYLTGRSFRYRVGGDRSLPHPIRAGVPQGSALSPLLFSLYTSDYPRTPKVEIALFADDTALYSTGWNWALNVYNIRRALVALERWFRMWRITVNPEKSVAIRFSNEYRRYYPTIDVKLSGKPILWAKSTKYLGVTLDYQLNFSEHIRKVRKKAAFVQGRLYPLINSNSKMPLRSKLTLYKTCIRPIMTYASVTFAHASPIDLYSLQVVQNRFIRNAVGAQWFQRNVDLHCDLELPSILQFMKEIARRYFDAAPHHSNPLIAKAADYNPTDIPTPLRRRPRNFLSDPDDDITTALQAAMESSSQPSNNTRRNRHRPRRRGR